MQNKNLSYKHHCTVAFWSRLSSVRHCVTEWDADDDDNDDGVTMGGKRSYIYCLWAPASNADV